MTQLLLEVLIVGLLTGLVGIIWMIVRDCFDDDPCSTDKLISLPPLSEPRDREESHEQSSRKSKVAA
jgi:hypothetical protein